MSNPQELIYRAGNLTAHPKLGRVTHADGQSIRLSPINMKVLETLISHPGQVISRSELFSAVWKNQVVSDDTLTRCISDIRAGLKELAPDQQVIQTIPKQGYRWAYGQPADAPAVSPEPDNPDNNSGSSSRPKTGTNWPGVRRWMRITALYGIALAVFSSLLAWAVFSWERPGAHRIAVLPTQTSQVELREWTIPISETITRRLHQLQGAEILANSAITTGLNNPFPYYYFEYGVQWVVESRIYQLDERQQLTLSLVDARTAMVLYITTENISDQQASWDRSIEHFFAEISVLIPVTEDNQSDR